MATWAPAWLTADLVSSLGLVLDIAGAVFIVKSLLWISDDELGRAADSVAVYGDDAGMPIPRPELMAMFRATRRDARIGTALLAGGFLLQLIALWL